ncbi:two-component regulator propeller domain-containing protein [Carboxylicivirga sp. N1Y90]|uniref:two-component regulator propeller domain-containing protein n=1 Tax=Carboxylicivirga fragile TaxID=3417571 RepID=UPI003D34D547|nr:SpoIIE family protein phosphatase [Marinilabiliaceae bacterium N1Y90]
MGYYKTIRCSLVLFLIVICCFFSADINAQSFDFKNYNSEIGLPQNYIYGVEQGNNGYIWMATGEGLVRYDGFDFKVFTTSDSLAHDFINTMHVAKNGNLWLGHKNGDLTYYKDGIFTKYVIDETSQLITDISEDDQGGIWAVEQTKGLIHISNSGEVSTYFGRKKYGNRRYYSIQALTPWKFLVGTDDGLVQFHFTDSNYSSVLITDVEGIPQEKINVIVPCKGGVNEYWIGTNGDGFYKYKYGSSESEQITDNKLCLKFNIERETVNDIFEDQDGHLLIATKRNGVIKLFYDSERDIFHESMNFSTINGLNVDYVTGILSDREGNYWFGTYGGGVASLINQYFIFYDLEEIGFKSQKVYSVLESGNELWLGLDNGLIKHDPLCFTDFEFYDPALGIPRDKIVKLYEDENEVLWVASANNGLYYRPKGELRFKPFVYTKSASGKKINDIIGFEEKLYLGTSEGLYVINTRDRSQIFYDMANGLSHNTINFVYRDMDGVIWVGTKDNGICSVVENKIERHKILKAAVNVVDMTEDKDGNKWLATKNKGILMYSADSLRSITIESGLKKNYCYSIDCDSKNRLWVCHHVGLSSVDLNTGQIRTFDYENNMDGEFNQVIKAENGTLWFASSDGVVNYNPLGDIVNQVAPLLNLTSLKIDDESYPANKPIKLKFPYGKNYYNLKLEFRAISFVNPEGVKYDFKIDDIGASKEDQKEWSKLGKINFKEIDYLRNGDHRIRLRAYNADGVSTITPATIDVLISKPFWETIWFIIPSAAFIVFLIFLFIKYRERKLQHQKQILQREVASQTVVLREQKDEIERKNRDITDSINYAKKIQSSILPPLSELNEVLPDSFVYFLPRDIVSGDFYWFNRSKDYMVICCADCTGHGVPGAFMSMIGTTILNDIFRLPEINSPAAMLERLDKEIKVLLQKNEDSESKDGMDISVIEIHLPTNKVRLASAKRPVYLIINDEMTLYKGNRRSIGDDMDDGLGDFVNIEYNCSKGDQIYMFSDGYPDQFGGPLGKKFMKVGVQNLIEEIYEKPADEQYKMVKENFENWMGELEQIDDVLFMGVKL